MLSWGEAATRRSPTTTDPEAHPSTPERRAAIDDLAEVDRARLFHRLPDRRLAQGGRAEPVVVGRDAEELHRARQPVVQPGPAPLDPEGDVEVAEADDEGRDDVAIGEPAAQADQAQQQDQADGRVEVDQPVRQDGHDHERHEEGDDQAQPVEGEEAADPRPELDDPRFQFTGVHGGLPPGLRPGTDRPAGPHPSRPGPTVG